MDLGPLKLLRLSKANWQEYQTMARETFIENFGPHNTVENMNLYVKKAFSDETMKAEVSNTNSETYMVQIGEESIGYLKLNHGQAQTDIRDDDSLEIERIYFSKSYQNRGYGKLLMKFSESVAMAANRKYLWLGVWEENKAAIKFYEREGYKTFAKHQFILGEDLQTDLLMKKELPG